MQHPGVQVRVQDSGQNDAPDRPGEAEQRGTGDEGRQVNQRVGKADPEEQASPGESHDTGQSHGQSGAQTEIRSQDRQEGHTRDPLLAEDQRYEIVGDQRETESGRQAQGRQYIDGLSHHASEPGPVRGELAV